VLSIIVLLVFVAVALGVFALASGFDERNAQARVLRERLESVDQAARRRPSLDLELLRDELLSEIPALNRLLQRWSRVGRLQRFIYQADLQVRAGKLLLMSACLSAVLGFLINTVTGVALFGLLFAAAGAAAPLGYVAYRRGRRFSRFEVMFPEAIDLLTRAVRAGHAFPTALELIATELGEPVSGEFRKLFEEQKFGLPIREALMNLAERMPLVDVKFFVTAVMLQRETGGNLAEILDKLSYVIRERFKIHRQVRVYTAQGRLTMMMLMGLPFLVVGVLMLINADFMTPLFTDPIGHTLITIGVVMQTIGFFLIRKIIHIQV
jgi:tight adherence protein B